MMGARMSESDTTRAVLEWATVFLRLSMHDFSRFARSSGFTVAQMNALMHLYYRGPLEVMALRDYMEVSPSGASQMVERMAQQGLVQRMESPDDRRVRVVHLTDEGRKIVEKSIEARQQWVEPLVASLTEEQQEAIQRCLSILTEQALRHMDSDA